MKRLRTSILFFVAATSLILSFDSCDTGNDFDNPDQNYFVKYYGTTNGNQTGVDMVVNADGTITMVGNSESDGANRIYFVRVDQSGNVLNERYLGGTSEDVKDIELMSDGNYLILTNYLNATNDLDVRLLKLSPEGEKIDSVTKGTLTGNDYAKSISIIDGSIFVAGTSDSTSTKADPNASNPDLGDFLVYKFDLNLSVDLTWKKTVFGYNGYDGFTKILRADNILVGFGYTDSEGLIDNPSGKIVFVYVELSAESGTNGAASSPPGTVNNSDLQLSQVVSTPLNPGTFSVGSSLNNLGQSELFVCKLKEKLSFVGSADAQLYTKFRPTGTNLRGISASYSSASPQGYLVLANDLQASSSSGNERNNIWAAKIDFDGQVIWSAKFGSEKGNDTAGAVVELAGGKILILGTTQLGDAQRKLTLIKVNSGGQLSN